MKRVFISIVVAAVAALGIVPATAFASSATLYNSLAAPQGNIPSLGFQANQTSQFGNEITLTRAAKVGTVTITMSSWGCQSGGGATCVTKHGATFKEAITLNIYQANATSPRAQPDAPGSGLPGALIKSITKTFSIPYRPSASSKCTGGSLGDWFDSKNSTCFAGFMTNIKFDLGVKLPQTIVFGIAYNTSQYGAAPNGCDLVPNANCPDELTERRSLLGSGRSSGRNRSIPRQRVLEHHDRRRLLRQRCCWERDVPVRLAGEHTSVLGRDLAVHVATLVHPSREVHHQLDLGNRATLGSPQCEGFFACSYNLRR